MKKLGLLMLIAVMAILGACSGGDSDNADGDTYKIKLGHGDKTGDDSITDLTANKFVELAEEYSDGKLDIEIYPANQLGDPLEQMESTQSGAQEMVQGSVNNYSELAPSMNYMTLPYMFTSKEQVRDAVDELWDKNNDILTEQADLRALVWTDAGPRVITSSEDHPVRTLDDLQGFKMRLPPSEVSETAFKAFGAQNITLPFSEVFTGLQQGTADGQENAVTTARTEHYYEVQKYITNIDWQYTISAFTISESYFQSLPEDLQDALVKAGKEATEYEQEKFDEMNEDDIDYLEDQGVEFLGQPEDFDDWVQKGRATWEDHYDLIGNGDAEEGKELIKEVQEKIE